MNTEYGAFEQNPRKTTKEFKAKENHYNPILQRFNDASKEQYLKKIEREQLIDTIATNKVRSPSANHKSLTRTNNYVTSKHSTS